MQIDSDSWVSLPMHSFNPYLRRQLSDVGGGLCYLHSRNVIHGDLKGVRDYSRFRFITVFILGQSNVVVDADGRARIAGFRFATVIAGVDPEQTSFGQWPAPEILKDGATNKETDIFNFAMVMIEVLCGWYTVYRALTNCFFLSMQVFAGVTLFDNTQPIPAATQGERPPRPTHPGVTGGLWRLIKQCWDEDPHLRPKASEVLRILLDSSVSHSSWYYPSVS